MADLLTRANVRLNSTKTLRWTFTDPTTDAPSNPGANPWFRLLDPNGGIQLTQAGWSNPSTGVYQRSAQFNLKGTWYMSAWVDTQTDAGELVVTVDSLFDS